MLLTLYPTIVKSIPLFLTITAPMKEQNTPFILPLVSNTLSNRMMMRTDHTLDFTAKPEIPKAARSTKDVTLQPGIQASCHVSAQRSKFNSFKNGTEPQTIPQKREKYTPKSVLGIKKRSSMYGGKMFF